MRRRSSPCASLPYPHRRRCVIKEEIAGHDERQPEHVLVVPLEDCLARVRKRRPDACRQSDSNLPLRTIATKRPTAPLVLVQILRLRSSDDERQSTLRLR